LPAGTQTLHVVVGANGQLLNWIDFLATNGTPSVPDNLAASAGTGQVALAWSPSAGATGYRVKMSTTSGGAYTPIASPAATGCYNTSLAAGATYYYVVSATNTAGESSNSIQVSATTPASQGSGGISTNCAMSAPEGLVSWWTGNPVTNAFGNLAANDLMGINNGVPQNGAMSVPGEVGYAFSFNGTNQYVSIVPAGSLAGTFTVDFWAMPMNTSGILGLIGSRTPQDYSYDLKFMNGNLIHGDIGNGSSWITTTADAVYAYTAGTWYHLASVVTPTNYAIYVNGSLVGSGSYSSSTPLLFDSNHNLLIGYTGFGTEYMCGLVDEVHIYNRALASSEVQAIYQAGTNGMCASTPLMFIGAPSYRKNNGLVVNAALHSGQSYRLQSNTNLVSTNWMTLTNFVAGTSPISSFTNPPATNVMQQFYRIVSP
jgi:hypothetical protein